MNIRWSFVLDSLASPEVVEEVDGEMGYGRVKDAKHWMAVGGASWKHPFGLDSEIDDLSDHPVVHVSYKDGVEYCAWVGRRLATEKEWEYAARGGRVNQTYPWGMTPVARRMNIWDGDFPKENTVIDGYHGVAPVKSFPPNDFGVYNMLGNVWEWVQGGTSEKRIMRGGSFLDSLDGSFNHIVMVSTKQTNSGDSAANNIGIRCASGGSASSSEDEPTKRPSSKSKSSSKSSSKGSKSSKGSGSSSGGGTTQSSRSREVVDEDRIEL